MTNLEFYSETIMGIIRDHCDVAIVDNKPEVCTGQCESCSRNEKQCDDASLLDWMMSDYCPFEKGSVIEVRDHESNYWKLAIFDFIRDDGWYVTIEGGAWKYAREYGSFGKEN